MWLLRVAARAKRVLLIAQQFPVSEIWREVLDMNILLQSCSTAPRAGMPLVAHKNPHSGRTPTQAVNVLRGSGLLNHQLLCCCACLLLHPQAPMEEILPPSGLIEWSTQGLTIPSKPERIFNEHPWICADRAKNYWAVSEGGGGGAASME
jgi:hypothetical protein